METRSPLQCWRQEQCVLLRRDPHLGNVSHRNTLLLVSVAIRIIKEVVVLSV